MKRRTAYLRRPLSFAVAMSMLLANFFSAGAAMAEEVMNETTYYDDTGPEETLETESNTYSVTLPWMEGCLYTYDQTHQFVPEETKNLEKQDIILNYQKDEEVKIEILTSDQYDVTQFHLYNRKDETSIDRREPAYTWDAQTGKLDFLMPEENLFLEFKIEEKIMEFQEEIIPAAEQSVMEQSAEVPVEQSLCDDEQNEEFPATTETLEMNAAGVENSEYSDQSSDANSYDGSQDTSIQEITSQETLQSSGSSEKPEAETTETATQSQATSYEMVLEMDGLPTQGSIIQMETMTIPFDTWDFDPETDLTNITFSAQEYDITYISDDVDYVNPGVYSSIYRVQERNTERMWYVLRPVRVAQMDETAVTAASENQEEQSDNGEEESAEEADPDPNHAVATETETETINVAANEDIPVDAEIPVPAAEAEEKNTSFDLYKTNADNPEEKLEGIRFRLFSSSDQEAEKARQIAEAVESLRGEQQLAVNAANTEAATVIGKLLQECDAEADAIRSEHASKLKAYQEEGTHSEEEILAFKTTNDTELAQKLSEKRTEHEGKILALMAEQKAAAQALSESNDQAVKDLETKLMEELKITDFQMLGTEFVTDKDGHYHQDYLTAGATYFLYETATLPGFNLDTNQYEFHVAEDGLIEGKENYILNISNQPNHVEISKKSSSGELLSGAKLEIRSIGDDGSETILENWITDGTAHLISKLPAGNYTLNEIEAPSGYAVAPVMSFTVSNSLETQKITMVDDQLQIHISLKDISNGELIQGAEMVIVTEEGNAADQWITNQEIHTVNLPAGNYTLKETVNPDRYVSSDDIHFTVDDHMADQEFVMYNTPKAEVVISKQDDTTKTELSGAMLALFNSDNNEISRWTTTEEANQMLLAPGKYVLKEIKAPEKYATAEEVTFEIPEDGYKTIQQITMYDIPLKVSISKKDLITDEMLSGAKLVLKDSGKNVVEEWTSKEEAKALNLAVGSYTLTEVTAPNGYEVAEALSFEVEDTREEQTVVMYDAPKEELVNLTGKKKEITSNGNTQTTNGSYQNADGSSYVSPTVKTGDYNRYLVPALILIAGCVMGSLLFFTGRKKRKKRS